MINYPCKTHRAHNPSDCELSCVMLSGKSTLHVSQPVKNYRSSLFHKLSNTHQPTVWWLQYIHLQTFTARGRNTDTAKFKDLHHIRHLYIWKKYQNDIIRFYQLYISLEEWYCSIQGSGANCNQVVIHCPSLCFTCLQIICKTVWIWFRYYCNWCESKYLYFCVVAPNTKHIKTDLVNPHFLL